MINGGHMSPPTRRRITWVLAFSIVLVLGAPMRLTSQALPSRPGETQPRPLPKARLAPLAEAQWTEAHRSRVAKFSSDGRVGNDFRTLLHVPELVDALLPYTRYLSSE